MTSSGSAASSSRPALRSRRPGRRALAVLCAAFLTCGAVAAIPGPDLGTRDERLRQLFTPPGAPAGAFEVFRSTEAIDVLAATLAARDPEQAPGAWQVTHVDAFEAFGRAAPYDRFRVARLYGGQRPQVARGSLPAARGRTAYTLVSPYPDASLERLVPGTLVIVFRLPERAGKGPGPPVSDPGGP